MTSQTFVPPSPEIIEHARELLPVLIASKYGALVPPNRPGNRANGIEEKVFDVHFQLCCTAYRFAETFDYLAKRDQGRERSQEHTMTGGTNDTPF